MNKGFASDNYSGAHPKVMQAINDANSQHARAYGNDEYTARAVKSIRDHFGKNVETYFVYNGTGANVIGLQAITKPFNSIICAETAHLHVDECGAPERFTGCKVITVPSYHGKISLNDVKKQVYGFGDPHHPQPRVISIAQPTELGTVYTQKEIRELADFAHANNMFLHMDGARLCNAAASLDCKLKDITAKAGVDVLSFGGTKNGALFGEAVIFFNRDLAVDVPYIRKQAMQLASKMRYIAVQFEALLTDDLCYKLARHSNQMAQALAKEVKTIPNIAITHPVQANAVFATVPAKYVPQLQESYPFYVWTEHTSEVRWMCSWDTTEEDIKRFAQLLRKTVS